MTPSPTTTEPAAPIHGRGMGALLSFLVPGLGQIYQGVTGRDAYRLSKGIFFLVTLWGMFFYGMWLGQWKNVYLPRWQDYLKEQRGRNDGERPIQLLGMELPNLVGNLYTRLQYVGQFWIGIAAWPALWNYYSPEAPILTRFYPPSPGAVPLGGDRRKSLDEFEESSNKLHSQMGKLWDIAWVYTVIAGVLNILVIYDAWGGPAHGRRRPVPSQEPARKGETA